jgi:hypothetical protein
MTMKLFLGSLPKLAERRKSLDEYINYVSTCSQFVRYVAAQEFFLLDDEIIP